MTKGNDVAHSVLPMCSCYEWAGYPLPLDVKRISTASSIRQIAISAYATSRCGCYEKLTISAIVPCLWIAGDSSAPGLQFRPKSSCEPATDAYLSIPAAGPHHRHTQGDQGGELEFVSAYRGEVSCTVTYRLGSRARPKSTDAGVNRHPTLTPVSVSAISAVTQNLHGPSKQPLTSHQSLAPASAKPRACSQVNSKRQPACSPRSWSRSQNEIELLQGRAAVARLAHNQEVDGSIPSPATTFAADAELKRTVREVGRRCTCDQQRRRARLVLTVRDFALTRSLAENGMVAHPRGVGARECASAAAINSPLRRDAVATLIRSGERERVAAFRASRRAGDFIMRGAA